MARRTRTRGRGRLSKIDLMPEECDGIIAWTAQELADRNRTQTEIYAEFVEKCQALEAEYRGEIEIDLPSFKAFNRHSMKLAAMTRRMEETREIASTLADRFGAKESDDLTIMAGEAIKSLVFNMLGEADGRLAPQEAMFLAAAFKSAVQAQRVSSDRRSKLEKEFEGKVGAAVEAVAKTKGLTAETAEAIKTQILGVSS